MERPSAWRDAVAIAPVIQVEPTMNPPPEPGLCGTCAHARVIENRRGSRFHLCERSRIDARYPRYPRLPVLECPGWTAQVRDEEVRRG